jgi:hypothetical protein
LITKVNPILFQLKESYLVDDEQRRKFQESMGYKVAPKGVIVKLRDVGDTASKDYDPKNVKRPDLANRYVDKSELLALSKIFQVTPGRKPAVFVPPPDEDD